ncbi:MAG: AsmA family protein [Rhizobiaceae bacterium]|nr:AsmA family protein [Rhizobiaceae bacterium]
MIVLALTAALVGPYFVDWTSYRADFEREASRILGRTVTVEGDARARLLPFPSLTFTNVTVASAEPGVPAMTVDEFSMDAELAPFMRGEVLIFDMRLVRPEGRISISQDGTIDWAMRPSSPFDPSQITLEKLTVSEGRITVWHQASGREHVLSELNADISARSLAGPWRIDGSMRLDGVLTAMSVSTGTRNADGRMRVRTTIQPEPYPVSIETDGDVTIADGAAKYQGSFRLGARPASDLKPRDGEAATFRVTDDRSRSGRKAPYRLSGKFTLDHQRMWVPEFRFESGLAEDPYTADGQAVVELGAAPRFSINADGAQVRLADAEDEGGKGALTFEERFAAFRDALLDVPRPSIPGRIDVKLPAIVAGDTTIRNIVLSAEPAAAGWQVGRLEATLPGRTTLEASGLVSIDQLDLGFKGDMLLAIGQPSGFAAWISRDVDEAIRRLPAAGFNAKVELTERRQSFTDLELALGDAVFRGNIDYNRPEDGRPSMLLDLSGGLLDVDGMAAFASLFVSDAGVNRLSDRDVDLRIKAGPVVVAGIAADKVDAALRLQQGDLQIDRLGIEGLEGARIAATGGLRGFPGAATGGVDASVVADDLAPLAGLLAERFPDNRLAREVAQRAASYPGLFDDTEIDLAIEASPGAEGAGRLAVTGAGRAGATDFSLTGSARNLAEMSAADIRLELKAENDEAAAIYALLGVPSIGLGLAGKAETAVVLSGDMKNGFAVEASIAGSDLTGRFDGTARMEDEGISASGKVALKADDIEPWLMTGTLALPGMGLGTPVDLAAEADYRDGLLILAGLSGTVAGGAVNGDVNVELADGLPHVTGELTLDSFDLAMPAAMLVGEDALEAGSSLWPDAPFRPDLAMPLTADIAVEADTLYLANATSFRNGRLSLRLDREELAVSDLKADFRGGELTGIVDIKNNAGTGLVSAQLRLKGAPAEAIFPETGLQGDVDLSAVISASGKSFDGLVAAFSGSGSASVDGLAILGINPDAFAALIAGADDVGRDIDAAATARFAPGIVRDGVLSTSHAETSFTIAGGIVRAPPVRIETGQSTVTGEMRADLNAGTIALDGEIVYEPGVEALVGSDAAVRFSLAGKPGEAMLELDTEPLAQFLTQRALELEQARVEAMQARLLERQRLRRETQYYVALAEQRDRAADLFRMQQDAEKARRAAEEEARRQTEIEARAKAREEARREAARLEAAREARRAERAAAREAERKAAEDAARQVEEERLRDRATASPAPLLPDAVESVPTKPPVEASPTAEQPRVDTGRGDRLPGVRDIFREENLSAERFGPTAPTR